MDDGAPKTTYMFRVLGWVGPPTAGAWRAHTSGRYPTAEACVAAARTFRDGEPPAFRCRGRLRNVYAVTAQGGQVTLRWVCEVRPGRGLPQ